MRRTLGQFPFIVMVLLPLFGLVGCADMFTTSRQSNQKGMRLYEQQMYTDAAGAFRSAIKQEPRDYPSHFYLGVCYDQLAQHQQAYHEYQVALEVMDNTIEGKHDDKFRQLVLDTYASAIAHYDNREVELTQVEKRANENPTGNNLFLLAKAYRLRGDADSSLVAYRKAANADKWDFYIRKEFGLYLLDPLGQRDQAAYYLQQAHQLDPTDVSVNTGLAQLGIAPPPAAYEAASPKAPTPTPQPTVQPTMATPGRSTANLPRD